MATNTIKMFFVSFLNTGVIILLVNAKITTFNLPDYIPIFAGEFTDFTVEWYRIVGSTICLTMIINTISPHTSSVISCFVTGIKRCCDRGCTCNKRRTKKMLQEDYDSVYIGPEFIMEIRYSQIISNIFICMLYSSGIPLLYPTLIITTILTYWIDKYLCKNSLIICK